ncbi:protein app1-like [Panicum virgatum]|nr:protein app1-like [Panicum virgatum]
MDPSNISVTPDNGGNSCDDNGGSSMHTSSCCRHMSSLPTGTQLATADGRGSGSSSPSSSSTSSNLESHRLHPEDMPSNQVRCLLLVSPTRSPAAMDDDVLIMDDVLVDNGPGSPSSARPSVSFVGNNDGPSNRLSVSISDLGLVSSGSQGAIGTGSSGGRRSGSSGQIHPREGTVTQAQRNIHSEVGSHNRRRQHQGAGPSNINQGQEFFNSFNNNRGQDFVNPFNIQHGPAFSIDFPYYYGQRLPVAPHYTYAPPMVAIHPAELYGGVLDIRRHPPSGVNITHPDGTPLQLPQRPRESRVIIAPPPAPEQPVTQPPQLPAPEQPATPPQPPAPEHPETPPPPPQELSAPTFRWPPTAEEAPAVEAVLYGPSTRNRLPVFREICPR